MVLATVVTISGHEFVMFPQPNGQFKGKLNTQIVRPNGTKFKQTWQKKDMTTLTKAILRFGIAQKFWSAEDIKTNISVKRNVEYVVQTRGTGLNIDPLVLAEILGDGLAPIKTPVAEKVDEIDEDEEEVLEEDEEEEIPVPAKKGNWIQPGSKKKK